MIVKHFLEDKKLNFEFDEEIDHHNCLKLKNRLDYEIERFMPKEVIFDFQDVKFMDSAGVGLVLGRYKQISSFGGNMKIINAKERIKKILEMSGVNEIIEIIGIHDIEKTG